MGKLATPSEYSDQRSSTPGIRTVYGKFTTNGAGAIASSTVFGQGFTVARTAVGQITVTFARGYRIPLSVQVNAISNNRFAVPITFTAGSNRTGASLVIETSATFGTAADQAAMVVTFSAVFQNIVGGKGK